MKPSYFDRTPTIRTEKEMFQRLAERTGKLQPERGDRSEAVPPALPVAASTLTWLPKAPGATAIVSACGGYSVAAVRSLGGWAFEAYQRPNQLLGRFKTSEEAKAKCTEVSHG